MSSGKKIPKGVFFGGELIDDPKIIEFMADEIRLQQVKHPAIAGALGISVHSLRNYLYLESRMPISVFLGVCEYLQMPAEFFLKRGSFRLNQIALLQTLDSVFGSSLRRFEIVEEVRASGTNFSLRLRDSDLDDREYRRTRSFIAMTVNSRYSEYHTLGRLIPDESREGGLADREVDQSVDQSPAKDRPKTVG